MYQHALGIDLHKRTSTWKLINNKHEVIWSRTVSCKPELLSVAARSLPVTISNLPIAIEPTCGWRWVSSLLEKEGGDLHIAHPYKLRLIADSSRKTDEEDAKILAEFLQMGYLPESWKAPDRVESWRRLVRTRVAFVQSRTRLKNQAESIITSLGPLTEPNNPELLEIVSLIEEHTNHIRNLEKLIKKIAEEQLITKLLMTMPSVGSITALSVLAEVGNFSRFSSADKLASYAGLVPSERSSGESVRHGRITKEGSKLLRTVIIETAIRFKPKYSSRLDEFFQRVKKTKGAMRARVALSRKLLIIMWSMVKNNKPFASSHDTVKMSDLVSNCLAH
jgi:transposase